MLRVRPIVCFSLLLIAMLASMGCAQEFRSLQITAWSSGFESPSATATMVDYAHLCNLNCVMPEIRLRADAYYNSAIEPPGTGVVPTPGYDSLADVIDTAHPVGVQVHPWVVTFRIWTTIDGPGHTYPEHIWWTHGPGNTNPSQDWLMYSDTGAWSYGGVSNLDPGHPAVEDYLISVFMDIVTRYDVDGLNLDYIRYPATNWGYNPVSVDRFNDEYGRSGNPSSTDTVWQNWRRDQITNLVKRLYLEIKAVKPWVRLSADVWNSWSTGNANYFQDWNKWMQNHWIDFVHPMMYTSNNTTYHGWLDDAVNRQYGRHVYPLVDASNDINGNVLPQIDLVRQHGFYGLGLYAYSTISNKTSLRTALTGGPFPTMVSVPDMPWLSAPTLGMLKGDIKNSSGNPIYPATVTVQSKSTKNTGTGFYGFVDLTPGTYTVSVSAPGYVNATRQVTITAGQVANLDITMTTDTTPPTISNVRTANVQGTNAQILWDTNEGATSQVEYGLTTSYGNQTAEDSALVTAHTVQLVGLTPTTTYHYRVKSRDGGGNLSVSGDYVFTTGQGDTVADIIIDNPAAVFSGSWYTGTSATDKYGSDYKYCTVATSETKSARWTPSIITAGDYDVYVWYPQGSNRSQRAPYTVYYNGGSATTQVNQQTNGGMWNLIASDRPFAVGTGGSVKLGNGTGETSLNVMADAVKFSYGSTDTQAPTVPMNLTATAVSGTQVDLTWTASTDNVGVTGYKIYRDGVQIGTSATTSYSDATCQSVHTYSYRVSACDAAGNESGQSTAAVVTTPDSIPPSAPTNLTATAISQTQINLAWNASTDNVGVAGYQVYRDGAYLTSTTNTSYSDATCQPATTYTYTVAAYDAAGNESALSNPATATTQAYTEIVIDNAACTLVGTWYTGTASTDKYGADYYYCTTAPSETKSATWTPQIAEPGYYSVYCWYPQGANRSAMAPYTVTWCSGSQTVNINQQTGGGAWVTLVTGKGFTSGTSGNVKLGNGTGESSLNVMADAVRFVFEASDTTPPSVPANLSATAVSPTQINLTWTASTDNRAVAGYKVFRNGVQVDTSIGTSYSDTGLAPSTTYTYTVSAYDEMGNQSAQSTPDSATTLAYPNIIVDNPAATFVGTWYASTSGTDKYGTDYKWASTAVTESRTAKWTPSIQSAGGYDVYAWWSVGSNRATNAPYFVQWNGGSQTVSVNQTINGGAWRLLLSNRSFAVGTSGFVRLGNGTGATGKVVIADATRFQQVN